MSPPPIPIYRFPNGVQLKQGGRILKAKHLSPRLFTSHKYTGVDNLTSQRGGG